MRRVFIFLLCAAAILFGYGLVWPSAAPFVGQMFAAVANIDFKALQRWQQRGVAGADATNEAYLKILCPEAPDNSEDHSLLPVSRANPLPLEYVPPNLIKLTAVNTVGVQCTTEETAEALKKLFKVARTEGINIAVTSGYRRPEIQQLTYDFWRSVEGEEKTRASVAEPGHSEHQTGTAVDFGGASQAYASAQDTFGDTKEGRWLARYAHRYGFTMSYPNREGEYMYEPWHFRYVGSAMARMLYDRGFSFTEYQLFKAGATSSVDIIMYHNPRLF